jgi:predicted MPP superfamily phosphohydrolase
VKGRRSLTRREWFGVAAGSGVAALAGYSRLVEPNMTFVTRHTIGRPTSAPPMRLVQLSDLHLRQIGRHEHTIVAHVAEERPSLILLSGDVVDDRANLHLADEFLGLLGSGVPKLAILGNWEHWASIDQLRLRAIYEKHNTRLLLNETATVAHGQRTLLVIGLDDFVAGTPDLARAMAGGEQGTNVLLLQHCPAYRDLLQAPSKVNSDVLARIHPTVMISGHTHGGQVAPFGWAPWRPFGSGRYLSGWYAPDAPLTPRMYVSRGLGTSIVPVRFGAPPEIAVFDWHLT